MTERERPSEETLNELALQVIISMQFVAESNLPRDSHVMQWHLEQIEVGMEILQPYLDEMEGVV